MTGIEMISRIMCASLGCQFIATPLPKHSNLKCLALSLTAMLRGRAVCASAALWQRLQFLQDVPSGRRQSSWLQNLEALTCLDNVASVACPLPPEPRSRLCTVACCSVDNKPGPASILSHLHACNTAVGQLGQWRASLNVTHTAG